MQTFYAIRQRSTGGLLPALSKGTSGHTRQKPSIFKPPRLFQNYRAARIALSYYLKGAFEVDYYDQLKLIPHTERSAEDFEVVTVRLEVTTP